MKVLREINRCRLSEGGCIEIPTKGGKKDRRSQAPYFDWDWKRIVWLAGQYFTHLYTKAVLESSIWVLRINYNCLNLFRFLNSRHPLVLNQECLIRKPVFSPLVQYPKQKASNRDVLQKAGLLPHVGTQGYATLAWSQFLCGPPRNCCPSVL